MTIKPPPGRDNASLGKEINKALASPRPVRLASYTVATVPSAGNPALIFVSDESGGAVVAFSDGTNWRRVTDRVVIS